MLSFHRIWPGIHDHKKIPIDSKALLRTGKICAFRASFGGYFLESIYPFGMRMGIVLVSSCLLLHGKSRVR